MAAIGVLGPLRVVDADQHRIELPPRSRRLLAALAVRANRTASPDWLAEAIWADDQPATPAAALQTLISRLRTALARTDGVAVVTDPVGYRLELARGALDLHEFEDLLHGARRPDVEPARAVELIDAALSLWHGAAYADYADEPFAEAEAARIAELQVTAAEDRAELLINTGQAGATLAPLIEIVRAHPFRERPVRLLMLAQHHAGRTAEALESFQRLRRRLADDLGLDPSRELFELQTQILADDPRLLPLSRQPMPTVELIGRDADQAGLIDVARRSRMVTVVGPGGVGKTSLVAAVAPSLRHGHADGLVLCELSRVPGSTPVAVAICTTLQIPVTDQDPYLRLAAYLADRELLLILDDCEHRADEVARAGLAADPEL